MAREFQKILNETDLQIKVVEKAGTSLKRLLCKSNPFRPNKCIDSECYVCKNSDKLNCKSRECVYKLTCACNDAYIGETSRSIAERVGEHFSGLKGKSKNNVLTRHMQETVLGTCQEDAMGRQILEATHIQLIKPAMNSKEEWGNMNVPRKRQPTINHQMTSNNH